MSVCRMAGWTLIPLARKSAVHLCRNAVLRRTMSSSVPGGSGQSLVYVAVCGASVATGLAYAYRTVATDQARYHDRVTELQARAMDQWQPKPWPPMELEAEEAGGINGGNAPVKELIVEAPLEVAEGMLSVESEPVPVESEPVCVGAELVSVETGPVPKETVDEPLEASPVVADLEVALAETTDEPPVDVASASPKSNGPALHPEKVLDSAEEEG